MGYYRNYYANKESKEEVMHITFTMAVYKYACYLQDVRHQHMGEYPCEDSSVRDDSGAWYLRGAKGCPMAKVDPNGHVNIGC
jgi:hypothetical protein